MTRPPFADAPKEGVVATNGVDYLRRVLGNLSSGTVTVPLRGSDDHERLNRSGAGAVYDPKLGGGWVDVAFESQDGDELAQISFTSGTEGAAKAVYLSRGNLHDVVQRLTRRMDLMSEVREYIGVPVYHSFGYGRARAVLNAGGACYVPDGGFNIQELRGMLRAGEINAISAVPSLWKIFLQARDLFGDELSRVRWVEIGSQLMSAEDKLALRQMLPNAAILQHYGLTEASRSTFLRIDQEPEAALSSVGRAQDGVDLRITDAGRIAIRGAHVALGVDDGTGFKPLDRDDWFETSDQGHIDDGLVYFDGRADDIINVSGIKLSPDLIEAAVRSSVNVTGDFGVLRRADPLRGEALALALTPDAMPQASQIIDAIDAYAQTQGVSLRGAIETTAVDALPRTATGKLQRAALQSHLTPDVATQATGLAAELHAILGPRADLTGGASFHDVEADSLAHLQMSLALERAFGQLPEQWEQIPLMDLVQRAEITDPAEATGTPPLPTGADNMNPEGIRFWDLVREDFRTNDASLAHQGFLMLFVHRFGNWRMSVRPKLLRAPLTVLYLVLNKLTQILFGMKLDYTVKVGRRVKLEHFGGMILGAREIGDDTVLRQNTTLGIRSVDDLRAKPVLGQRVDVGAGAVIVGNIHIGDNAIIGANSVVYMNVPAGSVVMGVPGKIIGTNPRLNPSPLKGHD